MPVILATQEAEIRRIKVWSQPGQIVCKSLSQKQQHKKRAGGVAQGVDPKFKPQYLPPPQKKTITNREEYFLINIYNFKELFAFIKTSIFFSVNVNTCQE
jgi:hypothetical protein